MIKNPSKLAQFFTPSSPPLLECPVMLYNWNKTTSKREDLGLHIFSLLPSPTSISFTISKRHSPPLISFPIPIQFDVKFHTKYFWGFSDQHDEPFLLQFTRTQNAYRALALLGLISAATDPARPVPWELPNQRTEGRPIAPGDTVKLSFTAFSIANFPYIGALAVNHSSLITKLVLRSGVPNFFDLLSGMFCLATRVIYVANSAEPKLPQGNVVYVVTVLQVRYAEDPETKPFEGESEYEYEEEQEEEEEEAPRAVAPEREREREREPERIELEPERELTPEEMEQERKANLRARMQRIGQFAGGLMAPMMPIVPGARLRKMSGKAQTAAAEPPRPSPFEIARTTEPPRTAAPERPKPAASEIARTSASERPKPAEVSRTAASESARTAAAERPKPVATESARTAAAESATRVRTLSERIDAMEAADRKLAALLQPAGGFNPDAVITGVSTLAAQLKSAQAQTEQLQRALQEVRAKAGESTTAARQAEAIRKELADAKRAGAALDRQVKENAGKMRELEEQFQDATGLARDRATVLIKELMDSVFQGMLRLFPQDGRWTGAEISNELAVLLRDQSEKTLAVITEKGLL